MSISIGYIPISLFNESEVEREIDEVIKNNTIKLILNSNAHLIYLANSSNKWLIDVFNSDKTEVFCDGRSVILLAKLFKKKVPEKITYNIWIHNLLSYLNKNNYSLFLLGSSESVSQKSCEIINEKYPNVKLMAHNGYFDKNNDSEENILVVKNINHFNPNVLLVCFGMPLQEKWILENKNSLNANVYLTGGAALDYFTGNFKMTPKLWDKLYLEWFYRLLQDPKRLWKRYTIGNLGFIYYSLKAFLKKNA